MLVIVGAKAEHLRDVGGSGWITFGQPGDQLTLGTVEGCGWWCVDLLVLGDQPLLVRRQLETGVVEIESGDPSLIRSIEAHDVVLHVVGVDRRTEAEETHLRRFFIDIFDARGLELPARKIVDQIPVQMAQLVVTESTALTGPDEALMVGQVTHCRTVCLPGWLLFVDHEPTRTSF